LSCSTGRVRALEGELHSLQIVITELEKTIAYQNKTAEDAKLQLEDEKWRLREHVQKLEDKVGYLGFIEHEPIYIRFRCLSTRYENVSSNYNLEITKHGKYLFSSLHYTH
jgi:hypothetical protein